MQGFEEVSFARMRLAAAVYGHPRLALGTRVTPCDAQKQPRRTLNISAIVIILRSEPAMKSWVVQVVGNQWWWRLPASPSKEIIGGRLPCQ